MTATDEQLARVKACLKYFMHDDDRAAVRSVLVRNAELRDKLDLCHHENCDLSAKVDGIPWLRAEVERLRDAERLLRLTCEHVCGTPADEQSSSLADISLALEAHAREQAAEVERLKADIEWQKKNLRQ